MIKPCILFLICSLGLVFQSVCQITLQIEISGLRNNKGQIMLELSSEQEKSISGISKEVTNKSCTIIIQNLKPGKYAFKYFHDENRNSNLDVNWLGIPTEGYGFSNNASGTFGPPAFEKTVFEFKQSIVLRCKPTYLL